RMSGAQVIDFPGSVPPGETIDLSVNLIAPLTSGSYRGYWMLRSADGKLFGLGDKADKAFWVDILVVKPVDSYTYDFAQQFCEAEWRTAEGRISCGNAVAADGLVSLLQYPWLENRREDELALRVHPNEAANGWIEGTYPRFRVQNGDQFKAWVGCLEGNDDCSLTFLLQYQDENGVVRNLGEWTEVYDGKVRDIDIDLSALAGQNVRFILRTEINNSSYSEAEGFWFVPRIERPAASSQVIVDRAPIQ
ncbi:MAG: hypothetical protein JW862_17185, partial [Anaerolineales bacterium]|nr:hypothetical protein [Anaerolineales bacterium]